MVVVCTGAVSVWLHCPGRLLEQLVQRIIELHSLRLLGSGSWAVHSGGIAGTHAERRHGRRVDPVIQAGVGLGPGELAGGHLLGQRADVGAILFVAFLVGACPLGGGVSKPRTAAHGCAVGRLFGGSTMEAMGGIPAHTGTTSQIT